MIRFPCPNCGREFTVDNALAGQSGSCSWCGSAMKIPQPYAEGTKTDETRDPAMVPAAPEDEHNPYKLADYRHSPPQGNYPTEGGGNPLIGWVILLIIILLINVILIPLTGWVVIPR